MNILCINTAFNQTYIALQSGEVVKTKTMDSSLKQSENVLGAVDECLSSLNLKVADLDVIACVIGPGSFTGIRIGASLAKGFCMACPKIKKIQVNSLDLIAYTYAKFNNQNKDFWCAINGLSGNVFACKYDHMGLELLAPCMLSGEEINTLCGQVVGLKDEQFDICNKFVEFDANTLLSFVNNKILNNEFYDDFTPLYLRKSQAEAELEKKNANC